MRRGGSDVEHRTIVLARDIAQALERFVGASLDHADGRPQRSLEEVLTTTPYLGVRQKAILRMPGLSTTEGVTTADVTRATAITQSNAHLTMKALIGRGLIEKHVTTRPQRYRLVDGIRSSLD
jgi:hypothetical protein